MRFEETKIAGAFIVDLEPVTDARGSFARLYCEREFAQRGLVSKFPQQSLSRNCHKDTLRGMHYSVPPHEETKLVRCVQGAIFDVIVDLRDGSPTYRAWFGLELSAQDGRALYIPGGLAHGFQTLTDASDVLYLISEFYEPAAARGVRWNDPAFNIEWPQASSRVMSDRDMTYRDFSPQN